MKILAGMLNSYQQYHTKGITKATHFIGIPCIVFALQLLIGWFSLSLLWGAMVPLLLFYLFIDVRLALYTAVLFVLLTWFAQSMVLHHSGIFLWSLLIFLFLFGWVMQMIGHYFEENRPAFLDNFLHVFIAPIFLVAEIFSLPSVEK